MILVAGGVHIVFASMPEKTSDEDKTSCWVEKCNTEYLPTEDHNDLSKILYKLYGLHFKNVLFSNFQNNRFYSQTTPISLK